ncbi:C40 family peptidase [bacterium]|nr:C40 family peptidase [bacterium]MCB2202143.1 C40 family peptidase [bacterium]
MKKNLLILTLSLLIVVGCSPYPRYGVRSAITPQEHGPSQEGYATRDFLALGMLLQSYLGTPYGARTKSGIGLDCSLFTQQVFWRFNRTEIPRTAEEQFQQGQAIPTRRLEIGDLVFFRTEGRSISHVGIYVGFNEFMHASSSRGVIISHMGETYWAERFAGARRILALRERPN